MSVQFSTALTMGKMVLYGGKKRTLMQSILGWNMYFRLRKHNLFLRTLRRYFIKEAGNRSENFVFRFTLS